MPKRPRIKERRNSMISYAKKHQKHHVKQQYFKGMFMPLYKSIWMGSGINNVMWNTRVDLDTATYGVDLPNSGGQTLVQQDWLNRSGDLNCVQCLPGRQIYMEFCALPIYKITDCNGIATTRSGDLFKGGYMRSFADLYQDCLNNHPFTTGGYAAHESDIPGTSASTPFEAVYAYIKDGGAAGLSFTAEVNQNESKLQRLINSTFMYEGGEQVHKFTNTTTLPVYIQIREFKPKSPMAYSLSRGDFPDPLTGTALAQSWIARFPGMYESIYIDRKSQSSSWANVGNSNSVHNNANMDDLFDEVDDRDFQYKGKMAVTDLRWTIGKAQTHRIDPGETFTYTMVLPPWSIKLIDMMNYMRNYRNHVSGSIGQTMSAALSDSSNGYAFNPMFSKFCSIRAWGSKGWVDVGDAGGVDQFDSYRPQETRTTDINNNVIYENRATNSAVPDINNDTNVRNPTTMKAAMISHAARLNHSMSEKHSCRLLPFVKMYAIDKFNWMPNALNSKLVGLQDQVRQVDPAEMDIQDVGGDNQGPEYSDTTGMILDGEMNRRLRDPYTDGVGDTGPGIEYTTA